MSIDIRYLIKDDAGLYIVSEDNSKLIKLEETELSSSLFIEKGMTGIPNGNFMKDLKNPSMLEWHMDDADVKIKAKVTALPKCQVIKQNYDSYYNDETIKGINYIEVTAEINENAIVRFAITFDGVIYYTFTEGTWAVLDIDDHSEFIQSGMTKETLKGLTKEQLESIFFSQDVYKYRFAVLIDYQNINASMGVEQIKIDYEN